MNFSPGSHPGKGVQRPGWVGITFSIHGTTIQQQFGTGVLPGVVPMTGNAGLGAGAGGMMITCCSGGS